MNAYPPVGRHGRFTGICIVVLLALARVICAAEQGDTQQVYPIDGHGAGGALGIMLKMIQDHPDEFAHLEPYIVETGDWICSMAVRDGNRVTWPRMVGKKPKVGDKRAKHAMSLGVIKLLLALAVRDNGLCKWPQYTLFEN